MIDEATRRDYAPTGIVRVALNHGNRVLVGRDGLGHAQGISVDLTRALATELGHDVRFIDYERAIDVSSSAQDDVWDICFLAVDPDRAKTIYFTHPYVRIEGCYLLAPGIDVAAAGQLLAQGHKIGTVDGSAYTLHLARQPGSENLVHYPDIIAALRGMDEGGVVAIAGIRQAMEAEAALRPGARVLEPPFMEIRQAMGMPSGRPDASRHLSAFLADIAKSGRLATILERHGVAASCAIVP